MQEFKPRPKTERAARLRAAVLPFKGQSLASLKSPSAVRHLGNNLGWGEPHWAPTLSLPRSVLIVLIRFKSRKARTSLASL